MDITSRFMKLVESNSSGRSRPRTRSRPLPNEFLKAASSLSYELIHTQQRLSQLYALYTVNVASSPYSTKTNDPLIDTLLSNGIQPVDFSSIPADAVPASMLKGLDATSAARIDDYVSSKLKETAMTLKGLEETVRAREQVLADARTIDLARKKQQNMSISSLIGLSEAEVSDTDEDEWAYSTGGKKSSLQFLEKDVAGKILHDDHLSANGKGSARFQAIQEGPTGQELLWRREMLHIIEGYISDIAETMRRMRKMRNEMVGVRYVSEKRAFSQKKQLMGKRLDTAVALDTEKQHLGFSEHHYEDVDVQDVIRAGGDLSLLQIEASKQDQAKEEELQAALRAESTMAEINQMLGDFAMRVTQQAETVQSIHDNVFDTNINVVAGNAQLQKALDRGSTGAKIFVIYFLVLTTVMLILDHIIS